MLQLALQKPSIAVLDETDSGLDVDALNVVGNAVNAVKAETGMGVLIITHYQRILHLIKPDRVSILFEGRIEHSGGPELVEQVEAEGYGRLRETIGA
jgi:Fe-S cluster assembly ATP-binding protein